MQFRPILVLLTLCLALASWMWMDDKNVGARKASRQHQDTIKPDADSSDPVQTLTLENCRELIHQNAKELAREDAEDRAAKVKALIQSLGTNRKAGLAAISEYLARNTDVYLGAGFEEKDGRITTAPSLRIALLDALQDWPGAESTAIASAILQHPERALEVAIAARILEMNAPGTHREEIIQAFQKLPSDEEEDPDFAGGTSQFLFSALSHFGAKELLPEAEKRALTNPALSVQFIAALESFPDAVLIQNLNSLLPRINVLAETSFGFSPAETISYTHPELRTSLRDVFATLPESGRLDYLNKLADYVPPSKAGNFFASKPPQTQHANIAVEVQGRLEFLKAIAPHCDSPDLQTALQTTQSKLEKLPQTIPSPELDSSHFDRKH